MVQPLPLYFREEGAVEAHVAIFNKSHRPLISNSSLSEYSLFPVVNRPFNCPSIYLED